MKKSNWHGGKGSGRRTGQNDKSYADNYDKIFGKKTDIKTRKIVPDHATTKTHNDESKYDRKSYKDELRSQADLNWDGNE